jgi:parallel beta-helix repeat protein
MNNILQRLCFFLVSIFLPVSLLAQGSLTPPGAPSTTMKSLDQLEPRTDVLKLSSDGYGSYVITQPGSYFLSSNLTGLPGLAGIEIKTNNVTLDLRGFTLTGNATARSGIVATVVCKNIRVFNGSIANWGGSGIDFYVAAGVSNAVIEDLFISGPGSSGSCGMILNDTTDVRRCQVSGYTNSFSFGFYGNNRCTFDHCRSINNIMGIYLAYAGIISDCVAQGCQTYGINATTGVIVHHNEVEACGNGIQVGDSCVASDNNCSHCPVAGIYVSGSSRIEGNTTHYCGYGITTQSGTTNFVARNVFHGNSSGNFNFSGVTVGGPMVVGTGTVTNHPWANFAY